jgi:hypothetical protein
VYRLGLVRTLTSTSSCHLETVTYVSISNNMNFHHQCRYQKRRKSLYCLDDVPSHMRRELYFVFPFSWKDDKDIQCANNAFLARNKTRDPSIVGGSRVRSRLGILRHAAAHYPIHRRSNLKLWPAYAIASPYRWHGFLFLSRRTNASSVDSLLEHDYSSP